MLGPQVVWVRDDCGRHRLGFGVDTSQHVLENIEIVFGSVEAGHAVETARAIPRFETSSSVIYKTALC